MNDFARHLIPKLPIAGVAFAVSAVPAAAVHLGAAYALIAAGAVIVSLLGVGWWAFAEWRRGNALMARAEAAIAKANEQDVILRAGSADGISGETWESPNGRWGWKVTKVLYGGEMDTKFDADVAVSTSIIAARAKERAKQEESE